MNEDGTIDFGSSAAVSPPNPPEWLTIDTASNSQDKPERWTGVDHFLFVMPATVGATDLSSQFSEVSDAARDLLVRDVWSTRLQQLDRLPLSIGRAAIGG